MSDACCSQLGLPERIHNFVVAGVSNELTEEHWANFEQLLRESDDACRQYLEYVNISVVLPNILSSIPDEDSSSPVFFSSECQEPIALHSPGFLFTTFRGTIGYFSHEIPFSFLIGAVLTSLLVLIGWLVPVSSPVNSAGNKSLMPSVVQRQFTPNPKIEIVGKITGMVDCKWTDPNTKPLHGANVPLGCKFVMVSGLMEITYNTGAKVILQGPMTYEVESKNGGFLPIGKLTGKVENKTAKGFSVRTPTAIVTDLGTEFGVEVTSEEKTNICMFQGKVLVHPTVGKAATRETMLEKGHSAHVDALGTVRKMSKDETATFAETFVHQLSHQETSHFTSLADLVAGGDGFGDRSNWGINPYDASVALVKTDIDPVNWNGKYQRYSGLPQIDGVFVPGGGDDLVQLDSAGHTFALPKVTRRTFGPIWACKTKAVVPPLDAGGLERQLAASHPTIILHANAGITFNLTAIRAAALGRRAARFQAVVINHQWELNPSTPLTADVWVFVDGQLRLSHPKLCSRDRPLEVDIPLGPNDQFLTLLSTDGGDGIQCDHVVYHNPRILLEEIP